MEEWIRTPSAVLGKRVRYQLRQPSLSRFSLIILKVLSSHLNCGSKPACSVRNRETTVRFPQLVWKLICPAISHTAVVGFGSNPDPKFEKSRLWIGETKFIFYQFYGLTRIRFRIAIADPDPFEDPSQWGLMRIRNTRISVNAFFLQESISIVTSSVVDPDWIRIQWGLWIRIRNPDPDPGGQKCPRKTERNKNFI